MQNILYLDTSKSGQIEVELRVDGQTYKKVSEQKFGSQVLLNLITQIVAEYGLSLQQLTAIEVHTGPGSYTGLKVGVAVANALAYSLKIPVNQKAIEVDLRYT